MQDEALAKILRRILIAAMASSATPLVQGCAREVTPTDGAATDGEPPSDGRSCTPTIAGQGCGTTVTYPCEPPAGISLGASLPVSVCSATCPPGTQSGSHALFCSATAGDAGATVLSCAYCTTGRRTEGLTMPHVRAGEHAVGDYLANHAMLEAASVDAFERLGRELALFGAPDALRARVARAADDERDHARRVAREAARFGGVQPGHVGEPERARSLVEIAHENVVEGCVRETFGALVALWQSAHTPDASLAALYATLAADETRHGALSLALATWFASHLDDAGRDEMQTARATAVRALRREVSQGFDPQLADVLGMPSADASLRLLDGLEASVWSADLHEVRGLV